MKPIHKYNNGNGATICNGCRTIISTGPKTEEVLCEKCKENMTLKKKFKLPIDANNKINDYVADQCEKIADDYAIEFAEWCDDSYFRMGRTNLWSDSTDWENNTKLTTKEILEEFKKETGL